MIIVREEQQSDIEPIRAVNTRAFGQSGEAELVEKLRDDCRNLLSQVAVIEDKVVGHILFSPATIETGEKTIHGMGLAPVAVLPEYQRQGIGSALITEGIGRLESRQCPFVIVLGHAEYYPRFGFEPARRYGIRSEWDVPDEAFMLLVLDESQVGGVSGVARYRPEFAEGM